MTDADQMFSDGKAYERMMGRWSKLAGRIFLDWLDAPKDLHWVEVGCGNGAFTEELIARTAPRAVDSIDPSEGQLAFARTRPAAKLAQFRLGEAQALPFADGRSFSFRPAKNRRSARIAAYPASFRANRERSNPVLHPRCPPWWLRERRVASSGQRWYHAQSDAPGQRLPGTGKRNGARCQLKKIPTGNFHQS